MTLFFPPSFSSYFLHFCVAKSFVTVQVRDAKMPPPSPTLFLLGHERDKKQPMLFYDKEECGNVFLS